MHLRYLGASWFGVQRSDLPIDDGAEDAIELYLGQRY